MELLDTTLATNCYEDSYDLVLGGEKNRDWCERLFLVNENIKFKDVLLNINDVRSRAQVDLMAQLLVEQQVITKYQFLQDLTNVVPSTWNYCDEDSFIQIISFQNYLNYYFSYWKHLKRTRKKISRIASGWNYSIPQMTSIAMCETKWLLWCSEDTYIKSGEFDWIEEAKEKMSDNDSYLIASPYWGQDNNGAMSEAEFEDGKFFVTKGVSDQCFLINVDKIRANKDIFAERNEISEKRYPIYGGNCFEKRLDAYMRNHNMWRLVSKDCGYIHYGIQKRKL